MPPKRRPNKYVYRSIVFAGVAAVKLFRVKVIPSGLEHLPQDEIIRGLNRTVEPNNSLGNPIACNVADGTGLWEEHALPAEI